MLPICPLPPSTGKAPRHPGCLCPPCWQHAGTHLSLEDPSPRVPPAPALGSSPLPKPADKPSLCRLSHGSSSFPAWLLYPQTKLPTADVTFSPVLAAH